MKQLKLLLLGAVSALLLLFVVFIPVRANAATIENGVPNALLREGKAIYKFTLDKDSLVEINWVKNNNNLANCVIYADRQKTQEVQYNFINSKSGKVCIPLKRGTYFVDMYDGATGKAPTAKVKFTWTPATKYDRKNYSIAKAYQLKPNTVEQVVQIRTCNYTRWYKIQTKKDQKITIMPRYQYYGQSPYSSYWYPIYTFKLYDSQFNSISISDYSEYSNNGNMVTNVLPKGTYYIVIPPTYDTSIRGDYVSLSWK